MSTLSVGKLIYSVITTQAAEDQTLKDSLSTKVYPIAAPADTTFPFVVYSRTNSYTENQTKDGWLNDRCSFSITVVSDKYDESVEVAEFVRDALENCILSSSSLEIHNIHLTSSNELFNEDEYIQNLYFECESNL